VEYKLLKVDQIIMPGRYVGITKTVVVTSWQYSKYIISSSLKEKYSKDKDTDLQITSISSLETSWMYFPI